LNNFVELAEMLPLMQEMLDAGGKVSFTPSGVSMLPMLRHRQDVVVLTKPVGRLKKYDLPLYRRDDGTFVLHRVVKVCADDTYTMCGDHQWILEPGISDKQLVGVVTQFTRGNRTYMVTNKKYLAYCSFWVAIRPLRGLYFRARGKLGKIKRALLRRH